MHANKERLFACTDSLSAIAQSIAAFYGDCPDTLLALPAPMLEPERTAWTQSERAVATSFERTITWRLGLRLIRTDRFDGSN